MRIIAATNSYWHNQTDFDTRYNGILSDGLDAVTNNAQPALRPEYHGRFGLRQWRENMQRFFQPIELVICCGTWSEPGYNRMPDVKVINAGVPADRPHSNGWQYMGCAMTALMAYVCNRRDWDLLILFSYEYLMGAVDCDDILHEFMDRPEEVFGPRWYERHSDLIGFKPAAATRFLHQRIRPNLTEDESVMWLDDELCQMFAGRSWNPWPSVRSVRQDFFHKESQWEGCPDAQEVLQMPFVRGIDPALIEEYERTQTTQAKPFLADSVVKA